jgi:hypothetical protein
VRRASRTFSRGGGGHLAFVPCLTQCKRWNKKTAVQSGEQSDAWCLREHSDDSRRRPHASALELGVGLPFTTRFPLELLTFWNNTRHLLLESNARLAGDTVGQRVTMPDFFFSQRKGQIGGKQDPQTQTFFSFLGAP